METRTYKVYKFAELPEEAKQKALENYNDINVDGDYWYDHHEMNDQIELVEFDLYRREIKIDFKESSEDTARQIIKDHGEKTETHQTSKKFLNKFDQLSDELENIEYNTDDYHEKQEEIDDLIVEYKNELAQDYLQLLQADYDYYTSEEAIIETLEANDYDFTTEGRID